MVHGRSSFFVCNYATISLNNKNIRYMSVTFFQKMVTISGNTIKRFSYEHV